MITFTQLIDDICLFIVSYISVSTVMSWAVLNVLALWFLVFFSWLGTVVIVSSIMATIVAALRVRGVKFLYRCHRRILDSR